MNNKIFYLIVILCLFEFSSQAQIIERFGTFASEWESEILTSAITPKGNFIAGGKYGYWGYLAEVNPVTGASVWEQHIESDYNAICTSVVVDETGTAYALIEFKRNIKLNQIVIDFGNFTDATLLLRIKPDGNYTKDDYVLMEKTKAQKLVYHKNTGLVVSLLFRSEIKFLHGLEFKGPLDEVLVASFDNKLKLNWAKSFTGNGDNTVNAMTTTTDGAILISGQGISHINFTGEQLNYQTTSSSNRFMYLAKINKIGVAEWVRILNKDGDINVEAITVDSKNNIYIGGSFRGNFSYGGSSSKADKQSAFVLSLDPMALISTGAIFGISNNQATVKDLYINGNRLAVVGNYLQSLDFGQKKITGDEADDAWRFSQNSFFAQWNIKQNKLHLDRYSSDKGIHAVGLVGNNNQVNVYGGLQGNLFINTKKRHATSSNFPIGFFHQRGFISLDDDETSASQTEDHTPFGIFDDFIISKWDTDITTLVAIDKLGNRMAISTKNNFGGINHLIYESENKKSITIFKNDRPHALVDDQQTLLFKNYTDNNVTIELYDKNGAFLLEEKIDISSLKEPYTYKLKGKGPSGELEIHVFEGTGIFKKPIDMLYYSFYIIDAAEVILKAKHKAVSKVISPAGSLLFASMLGQMEKDTWRYETVEFTSKVFDFVTTSESIVTGTFSKLDGFRKLLEWTKENIDNQSKQVQNAEKRIEQCKKVGDVELKLNIEGPTEFYLPCFEESAQIQWKVSLNSNVPVVKMNASTTSQSIKIFEKYENGILTIDIADLSGGKYMAPIVLEVVLADGRTIKDAANLVSRPCNYYYVPNCKKYFEQGIISQKELEACENDLYACIKSPKNEFDVFLMGDDDPLITQILSEHLLGNSDIVDQNFRLKTDKLNMVRKIYDQNGNPYKGKEAGQLRDHVLPAPCMRKWFLSGERYLFVDLWNINLDTVVELAQKGYRWRTDLNCFIRMEGSQESFAVYENNLTLNDFRKKLGLRIYEDDETEFGFEHFNLIWENGYDIEVMNLLIPIPIVVKTNENKSFEVENYTDYYFFDQDANKLEYFYQEVSREMSKLGSNGYFPVLAYHSEGGVFGAIKTFSESFYDAFINDSLQKVNKKLEERQFVIFYVKDNKNPNKKYEFQLIDQKDLMDEDDFVYGTENRMNIAKYNQLLNAGWLPYQDLIMLPGAPMLWYRDLSNPKSYEVARIRITPNYICETQGGEFVNPEKPFERLSYFQEYLKWTVHYLNTYVNDEMQRSPEYVFFVYNIVRIKESEHARKDRQRYNMSPLDCVYDTFDGEGCLKYQKNEAFIEFFFIREKKK
jgi:hypothetical protein